MALLRCDMQSRGLSEIAFLMPCDHCFRRLLREEIGEFAANEHEGDGLQRVELRPERRNGLFKVEIGQRAHQVGVVARHQLAFFHLPDRRAKASQLSSLSSGKEPPNRCFSVITA